MADSYGIVRVATKYEKRFERDFEKICNNKAYHIETLKAILEQAEDALNLEADNMANWGQTMQILYEVDDADTLWKKFQLFLMKWYTNWMYSKSVTESRYLGIGKEKLEKLLNRLLVLSAF